MLRIVHRVDLVETVRQLRRVSHVVDRLPHGPVRRHRDELGLHPTPGGIFRIKQAALKRDALRGRQLFEDFLLVLLVQALQQLDGVVGVQLPNALRNRFGFKLLEDLLADGIVELAKRREIEISTRQLDKAYSILRLQRGDQIAKVDLVKLRDHGAQERRIGAVDGARDLLNEFAANFATFFAHRQPLEHGGGGLGNVQMFGHAMPRRLTELPNSSELSLDGLANEQHQAQ